MQRRRRRGSQRGPSAEAGAADTALPSAPGASPPNAPNIEAAGEADATGVPSTSQHNGGVVLPLAKAARGGGGGGSGGDAVPTALSSGRRSTATLSSDGGSELSWAAAAAHLDSGGASASSRQQVVQQEPPPPSSSSSNGCDTPQSTHTAAGSVDPVDLLSPGSMPRPHSRIMGAEAPKGPPRKPGSRTPLDDGASSSGAASADGQAGRRASHDSADSADADGRSVGSAEASGTRLARTKSGESSENESPSALCVGACRAVRA